MSTKLNKLLISVSLGLISYGASADNLHQIYQQALQGDPQIKQAQANRDAKFEAINQTRSVLLPQISGSISLGNGAVDTANDSMGWQEGKHWGGSAGISLSQQIYVHGSWLNLSLSEKAASQSDAQLAQAQQGLILRVANAYFDVLKAQDDLSFAQAEKRSIERQHEQTKQRFDVGLTNITDLHEARAQLDLSIAGEILANNTVENSYEALSEITGLKHINLDTLNTKAFAPSLPTPNSARDWVKLAEENNLSLLNQRLSVDIAKQRINLAKSGHLPTLGATASLAHSYNPYISDTASIGLQLNVPIYSGGSVVSQTEQARFGYVASAQVLEQEYRKVVRSIRNNFNNVHASISSIKAYNQAAKSADSALEATDAGFQVGTRTIVDVLNSTRQVFNAKKQLSNARYSYILSILNLKQTAGTLTENDIALISNSLKKA
ncbi:MAG: outer membrane channel protein TolC [Gammaproteobacteria bacterium]|nr:outer membrane channel protein TolC [Gammaproteobacteria bacterium]